MKGLQESETGIRRSRKLCKADLDAVAHLIASRKLTQKEACLQLEIKPKQFEDFKSKHRNEPYFTESIERIRGATLSANIELIEKSAIGDGMKQRDWRAAAWITERMAPERFAQIQQTTPQTVNNVSIQISESIRRAYDADLKTLMVENVTTEPLAKQMQIKELTAPANGIVETRKLPPRRKGETR